MAFHSHILQALSLARDSIQFEDVLAWVVGRNAIDHYIGQANCNGLAESILGG